MPEDPNEALVPGVFPGRAFSVRSAHKDLSYALELAREQDLTLRGAEHAADLLRAAEAAGDGDLYWPVWGRVVGV